MSREIDVKVVQCFQKAQRLLGPSSTLWDFKKWLGLEALPSEKDVLLEGLIQSGCVKILENDMKKRKFDRLFSR